MAQMHTYIGEPRIDEARKKHLKVKNPDTRGYYVERLEVYEKCYLKLDFGKIAKEIITIILLYIGGP